MKRYNVHWVSHGDLYGGCISVSASDESEARAAACVKSRQGADFFVIAIQEVKR